MVIMEGQHFEDLLNASDHIEVLINQGKNRILGDFKSEMLHGACGN